MAHTHQDIWDRRMVLSKKRAADIAVATAQIDQRQRADQQQLEADCAALGHVVGPSTGYFTAIGPATHCVVCGCDPALQAQAQLARGLTTATP